MGGGKTRKKRLKCEPGGDMRLSCRLTRWRKLLRLVTRGGGAKEIRGRGIGACDGVLTTFRSFKFQASGRGWGTFTWSERFVDWLS